MLSPFAWEAFEIMIHQMPAEGVGAAGANPGCARSSVYALPSRPLEAFHACQSFIKTRFTPFHRDGRPVQTGLNKAVIRPLDESIHSTQRLHSIGGCMSASVFNVLN